MSLRRINYHTSQTCKFRSQCCFHLDLMTSNYNIEFMPYYHKVSESNLLSQTFVWINLNVEPTPKIKSPLCMNIDLKLKLVTCIMSQYAPSFTHCWNACRTVKAWEIVEISDILAKIAKHTIGIGYALRKCQSYVWCITS